MLHWLSAHPGSLCERVRDGGEKERKKKKKKERERESSEGSGLMFYNDLSLCPNFQSEFKSEQVRMQVRKTGYDVSVLNVLSFTLKTTLVCLYANSETKKKLGCGESKGAGKQRLKLEL